MLSSFCPGSVLSFPWKYFSIISRNVFLVETISLELLGRAPQQLFSIGSSFDHLTHAASPKPMLSSQDH
jgi:hypothetical protein